jgi:hypothetical protein
MTAATRRQSQRDVVENLSPCLIIRLAWRSRPIKKWNANVHLFSKCGGPQSAGGAATFKAALLRSGSLALNEYEPMEANISECENAHCPTDAF